MAYLIPDQFWSSTVTSAVEVFYGMQLNARLFQSREFRGVDVTLLRCTRSRVRGFSGLSLDTRYFGDKSVSNQLFDAVIVPSVWNLSMDHLRESMRALHWLRDQHSGGSIVAGLVTGVFYLAEAGLLDGREATIHWASVNIFKQRYPQIRVMPKLQMVESDNLVTTSTTPATFDVTLLLIQRFLGDRSAEYASHYFTIRDKDAPLPMFLEPSCQDTLVDAARDLIRMSYSQALSLETLAAQLNVTARTLSRRFVGAMGVSPIRYLAQYRLKMARSLLQSTDLQVQQIAGQTGFGSATVFCRQFNNEYGQSPRQYRALVMSGNKSDIDSF